MSGLSCPSQCENRRERKQPPLQAGFLTENVAIKYDRQGLLHYVWSLLSRACPFHPSPGSLTAAHFRQRRLRLGQPEGHVHGAVQLDGGGQFGTGLLAPAHAGHTGCRGRGGSGPGAGACPVPRPGRGPGGSRSPACSLSGGSRRAAMSPRRRRAYAWLPRSWCARASASARSARACASSRRPASSCASPRERRQSA